MNPNDVPKERILVIDDEKAIRRMLRLSLEAHGYSVAEAATFKDGLIASVEPMPDLILLDLGLPDGSGIDLLQRVREFSQIRIIVISARGSEQDKIALLDAGADDYLTKPFSMGELLARIRVALRHRQEHDETPAEFVSGVVRIDALRRLVTVEGRPVHLTPTEYALAGLDQKRGTLSDPLSNYRANLGRGTKRNRRPAGVHRPIAKKTGGRRRALY